MNIIFQINGGLGKCIMATAVCTAIKKKYPDSNLIVISGYPDVFLNNKEVYRSYTFNGISYFYDEYINNKEFLIFANDPYLETGHIKQEEHLLKTWCKMYGLKYNGEKPVIFLTQRETQYFKNKFASEKPIML